MPSASRIAGKDISASISRITSASSARNCAARMPITAPRNPETQATTSPTHSDTRAPYSTRVKMSRPNMSVPNR